MFTQMLELLKKGELPLSKDLETRLKPAIVKKSGVMQQPRPCWSNDPKINPNATHILRATIMLEDHELISMAIGILVIEQGQKLDLLTAEKAEKLLLEKGDELLDLAPTADLKSILAQKIHKAAAI